MKNNEIRENGEIRDILKKNSLSSLISLLIPISNIKNNERSENGEGNMDTSGDTLTDSGSGTVATWTYLLKNIWVLPCR